MKVVFRSPREGALVPYVGAALVPFSAAEPEHQTKIVVRSRNGGFMIAGLGLAIGLLAAATVAGVGESVLWLTGESWAIERVVRAQEQAPIVYQRGLLDPSVPAYKLRSIQMRRPRVLALGSLRTANWRGEMFGDDAHSFFNAAGLVNNLTDVQTVLDRMPPGYSPRLVILGLDFWWFNYAMPAPYTDLGADAAGNLSEHAQALAGVLINPWRLTRPASSGIGLGAQLNGRGYRTDGSWESSGSNPELPGVNAARRGELPFPECRAMSGERLQRLVMLLQQFQRRGVFVAGYAPPLSADLRQRIAEDEKQKFLWNDFLEQIPYAFLDHGFVFIDGSDTAKLGAKESDLADHITGGERYYTRLLAKLRQDPRIFAMLPSVRQ
ncbi:MAG: hypothetical protein U0Q16_20125 [Bryobacteraceae bacterium]